MRVFQTSALTSASRAADLASSRSIRARRRTVSDDEIFTHTVFECLFEPTHAVSLQSKKRRQTRRDVRQFIGQPRGRTGEDSAQGIGLPPRSQHVRSGGCAGSGNHYQSARANNIDQTPPLTKAVRDRRRQTDAAPVQQP